MSAAANNFAATDATHEKGGAPVGGRPEVGFNTMLHTLTEKDQQASLDFLTEGFAKITAIEMHRVLQQCGYEHQRPISEQHVAVLSDLMSRGKWQSKSQIDFALLNGRHILVNGYHRGAAQVRSGKAVEWNVAVHRVKSETDLRSLYYAFDTNVRVRNAHDIISAYEFAGTTGLPATMASALYGAAPMIASKFETSPKKKDNLTTKAIDRRLSLAVEYAKAAGRYAACLEGIGGFRKKRFLSAPMTAVAVVTFRYQSELAWTFWSGVAQNDGLKRGDPRHALAMDMFSRVRKESNRSLQGFAPSMLAWNAFFEERPLQMIRVVPDTFVPAIAGTPFDGKKA